MIIAAVTLLVLLVFADVSSSTEEQKADYNDEFQVHRPAGELVAPGYWTYHFGLGEFLNPDWQGEILAPAKRQTCVLVVQTKGKLTLGSVEHSIHFPYCIPDNVNKSPVDTLHILYATKPQWEHWGYDFYILRGLTVTPEHQERKLSKSDANEIKKITERFINPMKQAIDPRMTRFFTYYKHDECPDAEPWYCL